MSDATLVLLLCVTSPLLFVMLAGVIEMTTRWAMRVNRDKKPWDWTDGGWHR